MTTPDAPGWKSASLKHMSEVGIRALQQNASAVVATAASGETVTITDHGRPVARLVPLRGSRLRELVESGDARPATADLVDLPEPTPGPALGDDLRLAREAERH